MKVPNVRGQHDNGQLLAGVQDHEALHVHKVLPALNVLVILLVGGQGLVVKFGEVHLVCWDQLRAVPLQSSLFLGRDFPEGSQRKFLWEVP